MIRKVRQQKCKIVFFFLSVFQSLCFSVSAASGVQDQDERGQHHLWLEAARGSRACAFLPLGEPPKLSFSSLSIRWSRSTCLEGCADTTERAVPSGTTWSVLWIPKVSWCQPASRTSWKRRSDTRRCSNRSVGGSRRRFEWTSCSLVLSVFHVLRVACFHLLSAGKEHWNHHIDLRLWGTRTEAHLETSHRNLRRGLSLEPSSVPPVLSFFILLFLFTQILTMFEDNYPEGLKRVFLIKGTSAHLCILRSISLFVVWFCPVLCFLQLPKCSPWPTTWSSTSSVRRRGKRSSF